MEQQTEPHIGVIVAMWLLTFGYFALVSARSFGFGSLCGFSSFIIGIYLVTRQNSTDRTNGWIRIGIGIAMGAAKFVQSTGS